MSKVDCTTKVAHITDTATKSTITEPYDYLIVASGLRRAYPTVPKSLRRDEFLEEARKHTDSVRNAQGVVIVGGGTHPFHWSRRMLIEEFSFVLAESI